MLKNFFLIIDIFDYYNLLFKKKKFNLKFKSNQWKKSCIDYSNIGQNLVLFNYFFLQYYAEYKYKNYFTVILISKYILKPI